MGMDSNAIVLIGIQPSTAANYGAGQAYNAKARLYVTGGGTASQPFNIVLCGNAASSYTPAQYNGICFGAGSQGTWHVYSYADGGGRASMTFGGDSGSGLNTYHKFSPGSMSVNSQLATGLGPNVFHVLGQSTSNIAYFSNVIGGPNSVVINANAWVGIGTSVPTGPLSVAGYSSANLALFTSSTPGGANVVVINSNAWVGIGTTNPTSSLTVNGNASFATDTFTVPFATMGTLNILSGATIGPSSPVLGSNLLVLSNVSGGSNVTIFTGNAMSIGTLAPAFGLHISTPTIGFPGISGAVAAGTNYLTISSSTGAVTMGAVIASDVRLKTNIQPLTYGLNSVLNMKPVSFSYISGEGPCIGFIAQEMINVVPEVVNPPNSEGYLSIDYEKLTAVLVNALKETSEKLEMAQNDIDLLETRLSDLEAIVRTLIPQKETTQTGPRSAALINQL
jgi:hypothetical protein